MDPTPAVSQVDGGGTSETEWSRSPEWNDVPDLDLGVGRIDRLLVVAAHPGDEALGAGGLISMADARDIEVHVVLLTAGEGSHPESPTHSARMLSSARQAEFRDGLAELAPIATTTFLGLADGQVRSGRDQVVAALVDLIGERGEFTLVVAPWRQDEDTDHAAAGEATAVAAARTDAQLLEYPLWHWHRGTPATTPWRDLQQLSLTPWAKARKSAAIAHHRTQTEPLSSAVEDEPVLGPAVLSHFDRDREVFVVAPLPSDAPSDVRDVDEPPTGDPPPWSDGARWYAEHAQAVVLASLPQNRFVRGLELGCSIDGLAAGLARRCQRFVAVDASPAAIAALEDEFTSTDDARAVRLTVPEEWPEGQFDLVVLAECGYLLSPRRLRETVARVRDSLAADGVLVLCHWRHRIPGRPLSGEKVHDLVLERAGLHVVVEHRERDLLLQVLSRGETQPLDGW